MFKLDIMKLWNSISRVCSLIIFFMMNFVCASNCRNCPISILSTFYTRRWDERHISFKLCEIVTVISQFWQQLTAIFICSDKTDIESPDSSIITSSAANNIFYHDLRADNSFHTFNRQKKVIVEIIPKCFSFPYCK